MNTNINRIGNQWVFADGTVLPVVSGGDGPLDTPIEPTDNPVLPDTPAEQESLGNDFLKNVAEDDRPYVEKYIKDWDSGVTQRFQKIHSEYEPYKKLGDPESLSEAVRVMEMLNTNPQAVYDILKAELEQGNGPVDNTVELPKKLPAELEGLPEPFVEQWQAQQTMLENIAKLVLSEREQTQQKQEDQALAAELDRLKKQHGDFDEEYIMTKMYHGASGDDAVKAYQALVQNVINSQSKPKPQPPSLFGGGPLPADKKDVTEMDKKDVKSLIAGMLKNAAEG